MKSFKQFLTEANKDIKFKNENEFVNFCKKLCEKFDLTYSDYEFYEVDDCEFYFDYKGKDYCLQFSTNTLLFEIVNDDSKYIGKLKKPLETYKNFNDLLKDAKK